MFRRLASTHSSVAKLAQRFSASTAAQSCSSSSGVRQLDLPQFWIAVGDDRAFAGRIDHHVGRRRHRAGHAHEVGLDPFLRQLRRRCTGSRFPMRRPWDLTAATRPPSRTMPMPAFSALPPAISSKLFGAHLLAAAGQFLDVVDQIAHRHADAENPGRLRSCGAGPLVRAIGAERLQPRPGSESGNDLMWRWRLRCDLARNHVNNDVARSAVPSPRSCMPWLFAARKPTAPAGDAQWRCRSGCDSPPDACR